MKFVPIKHNSSWFSATNQLELVLAQTPAPSKQMIESDHSRPISVSVVANLLGPTACLSQIVSGNKPAVILMPELALGSGDWAAIDEIVRSQNRQLILISGFGLSSGERLTQWAAGSGPTNKMVSWPAEAPLASERHYNGGYCWIRKPGEDTVCIAFIKNTAEQLHEIQLNNIDQSDFGLCLELNDLILFPVICADFLAQPNNKGLIKKAIEEHLGTLAGDNRKILIAGLLLQKKASVKWRNAITDVARGIDTAKVNICTANSLQEMLAWSEDEDRWRNYSGVFIASGRKPYDDSFHPVRRFGTEQLDGAPVRATSGIVLGGPMLWAYNDPTARHIWEVHKSYGIDPAGALIASPCDHRFKFEALRTLLRITKAADAPPDFKTQLSLDCFDEIAKALGLDDPETPELLFARALFGESGDESKARLSPDSIPTFLQPLANALRAVGAIKLSASVSWKDSSSIGQFQCDKTGTSILAVEYPGSAIRLKHIFDRWETSAAFEGHLVVFARASGPAFDAPDEISGRRRDIGQPPKAEGSSIDEPQEKMRLIQVDLMKIEVCFAQPSLAAFRAAVDAEVQHGISALAN